MLLRILPIARQRNHQPVVRPRARLPRRSSSLPAGRSSPDDAWAERRLQSILKTVKADLSSLPAKLGRITEEGLEPTKKISRDAVSLTEELRAVREMMEKVFRSQEEDVAIYRKLFEDLMAKHKSLLEDLITDAKEHEDREKSLRLLEELVMRQSKKMEDMRFKLSVKMMGGDTKEEEVSQSLTAAQMSIFGDEEEAEQGEMMDGVRQTVSDSQKSPYSDEEEEREVERRSLIGKDYLIVISSDSEDGTDSEDSTDSDSSLAMIEE